MSVTISIRGPLPAVYLQFDNTDAPYTINGTTASYNGVSYSPANPGLPTPAVAFFSAGRIAIEITTQPLGLCVDLGGPGAGSFCPPLATDQAVSTPIRSSSCGPSVVAPTVTVAGTGGSGFLSFAIYTQPTHGILTPVLSPANSWIYTPTDDYVGPDSFQFTCSDGVYAAASIGTVTIDVTQTYDLCDVQPNAGPVTGGTAVTLTGVGFVAGMGVTFGGTAATSVVVIDQFTATCVTPAHAGGLVTVAFTNAPPPGSASLSNAFNFGAVIVTSIDPVEGPIAGGTPFTLTGANFTAGMVVTFDGVAATSINVVSDTAATGVSPAHETGVADVTVTLLDTQTDTLEDAFRFFPPQVLESSPPFQTPGQWALHRIDLVPTKQGPAGNKGNV